MTEPPPNPRVSNKVSPLAVIVAIILVGIVIVALVRHQGTHTSATGEKVPTATTNSIMPEQSSVPNGPAPRANTNDSVEATPTGNDVGNPGAGGIGNSTR